MRFEDRDDGEFRIHAGSLELREGEGHLASVIVNLSRVGKSGVREIYRNLQVSGGHRWPTSEQALHHALMLGTHAVAAERHRTMSQAARPTTNAAGVNPLPERRPTDLSRPLSTSGPEHV